MSGKDGRPFAVAVASIPVAVHFSLWPGVAIADAQKHLPGVQQANERAKWACEPPEDKHLFTEFCLTFDVFNRGKDSRVLEEKFPIVREGTTKGVHPPRGSICDGGFIFRVKR